MIALPLSSKSSSQTPGQDLEIQDPFLDYTQSIFAGLSFPEAPKNDLTLLKPKQTGQIITQKEVEHLSLSLTLTVFLSLFSHTQENSMIELQPTLKPLPPPISIELPSAPSSSITHIRKQPTVTTQSQAVLTPSQFALLYRNEVAFSLRISFSYVILSIGW